VIIGAPGVEIQRGGRPFVSHDALDHVHGDAVVDQPGGVGMPEIMKTWAESAGFGDVQDGFTFGNEFLGESGSAESANGSSRSTRPSKMVMPLARRSRVGETWGRVVR
jgi:hypothetical protein